MTVNNQTYLWTRPLKYTPSPIRFFRISPHQNHSVSTKPIIAYSFHVVFTTPLHKTCNRKRYVSTSIHRLYRHTRIVYKYHYLGNRSIYIYISTRYFSTFAFAIDRIWAITRHVVSFSIYTVFDTLTANTTTSQVWCMHLSVRFATVYIDVRTYTQLV